MSTDEALPGQVEAATRFAAAWAPAHLSLSDQGVDRACRSRRGEDYQISSRFATRKSFPAAWHSRLAASSKRSIDRGRDVAAAR